MLADCVKIHEKLAVPDWYARYNFRDFLMKPESIVVFGSGNIEFSFAIEEWIS